MLKNYYSIEDVMSASGRSRRSIYRDIQEGLLKAHKCGGHWRVSEDDFAAYMNDTSDDGMASFDALLASVSEARPRLTDDERMRLMSAIMAVK